MAEEKPSIWERLGWSKIVFQGKYCRSACCFDEREARLDRLLSVPTSSNTAIFWLQQVTRLWSSAVSPRTRITMVTSTAILGKRKTKRRVIHGRRSTVGVLIAGVAARRTVGSSWNFFLVGEPNTAPTEQPERTVRPNWHERPAGERDGRGCWECVYGTGLQKLSVGSHGGKRGHAGGQASGHVVAPGIACRRTGAT